MNNKSSSSNHDEHGSPGAARASPPPGSALARRRRSGCGPGRRWAGTGLPRRGQKHPEARAELIALEVELKGSCGPAPRRVSLAGAHEGKEQDHPGLAPPEVSGRWRCCAAHTYGPQRLPRVSDSEDPLVDASGVVPGLIVAWRTPARQLRRARALPPDAKCRLRRSVAQRLANAAAALRKPAAAGRKDCTRPPDAQAALWKAHPHPGAVADPARGSLHARGVAVDLELADPRGCAWSCPRRSTLRSQGVRRSAIAGGTGEGASRCPQGAMYAAGFA